MTLSPSWSLNPAPDFSCRIDLCLSLQRSHSSQKHFVFFNNLAISSNVFHSGGLDKTALKAGDKSVGWDRAKEGIKVIGQS